MSKQDHAQQQLITQASEWLVRLRGDNQCPKLQRQFSQWLNQSTEHARIFDQVLDQWRQQSQIMRHSDTLQQRLNHLEQNAHHQKDQNNHHHRPQTIAFSWHWGSGLAAALVLIIALAVLIPEPSIEQYLTTEIGQIQKHQLSDNSQVQLNTNSEVLVRYNKDSRELKLVRGEVHFDVAHDPQRPFIVITERGQFTALGTAFTIRQTPNNVSIQVTEGTVLAQQHSDATTPHPQSRQLTKDQRVDLASQGFGQVHTVPDEPSWQKGLLQFHQTSLEDAIQQLNRYLENPVRVDATLAGYSVSGVYRLDEPELALKLLAASERLHLVESIDGQRQLSEQP